MTAASQPIGIIVISHGSPRAEANQGFTALVERLAARLEGAQVLPAFFSIARPDIADQVAVLAGRGLSRLLLLPYFLFSGQHVTVDIPVILEDCRRRFPQVALELLPTLENDPALEDVLVERLTPLLGTGQVLPRDGAAIERRSYAMIDRQLGESGPADPGARNILRRVVHATADISFVRTLRIHPQAVPCGQKALAEGKPILCDVHMLQAGVTRVRNEVLCAIDREEVLELARTQGCTRAAAAMQFLAPRLEGAIVAIGNAPTALWKILELARSGGPRPALVVGLPVGFVGARESKLALLESDLCWITNTSPRGGSPVAAAAVNALATMAEEE
jgi:precorrin-8X/cobalt-precorrin-8 methylmutase